eukprot:TRINITY_DN19734_c0_g1_i1.p1 TRINITY_DN19734_c0_g1~~TRINITY_DN19734_c0_g1_i1.p1  ORF type:complete len:230 (-),score=26.39 TRINITY_DN19734_c0_g1_i1:467-1156(-)
MVDVMKGSKIKQIVAGWSLFAGTHMLMSHPPVRSYLVSSLGEGPFAGLYSAVSLATLGPTTYIYGRYGRGVGSLGGFTSLTRNNTLVRAAGNGLKLSGLITFGQAVATPPPVTAAKVKAGDTEVEPRGIYRITRHPMFMSFALLGLGNILTRGFAGDVVYWGAYPIFWVVGSAHQDYRQRQELPAALYEKTSLLPFAAIAEGRNSLEPISEELNKPTIATAVMSSIFWL